jgi:hypothetical protein
MCRCKAKIYTWRRKEVQLRSIRLSAEIRSRKTSRAGVWKDAFLVSVNLFMDALNFPNLATVAREWRCWKKFIRISPATVTRGWTQTGASLQDCESRTEHSSNVSTRTLLLFYPPPLHPPLPEILQFLPRSEIMSSIPLSAPLHK